MSNVFALIVGISKYQSRHIRNLESPTLDARRIQRYLVDTLDVPVDNIQILLDASATQRNIEDAFLQHLISNPLIQYGDAIIIYWAGHGSRIPAPDNWLDDKSHNTRVHNAEVLCTYDYEQIRTDGTGRVAGISDRSMKAMLGEVADVKGDNITFIIDSCFAMPPSPNPKKDIRKTRCTPTLKATPGDLYRGLWPAARGHKGRGGFRSITNFTTILACSKGERAVESKTGGKFTSALIKAFSDLSLHRTTNAMLCDKVQLILGSWNQGIFCAGDKDRMVFDGIPFEPDPEIFALHSLNSDYTSVIIDAGTKHGLRSGIKMTIHLHQYSKSRNDTISMLVLDDVSTGHSRGRVEGGWDLGLVGGCYWAKVSNPKRRHAFMFFKNRTG